MAMPASRPSKSTSASRTAGIGRPRSPWGGCRAPDRGEHGAGLRGGQRFGGGPRRARPSSPAPTYIAWRDLMDKAKQDKQPQNRPHQGKAPKGEPQRPGVDQPERGRQGEDKPDVERER